MNNFVDSMFFLLHFLPQLFMLHALEVRLQQVLRFSCRPLKRAVTAGVGSNQEVAQVMPAPDESGPSIPV